MQIEVFPVPTDPATRTVFPRGMPPLSTWSSPSMPVAHRSRSPGTSRSFEGISNRVAIRRPPYMRAARRISGLRTPMSGASSRAEAKGGPGVVDAHLTHGANALRLQQLPEDVAVQVRAALPRLRVRDPREATRPRGGDRGAGVRREGLPVPREREDRACLRVVRDRSVEREAVRGVDHARRHAHGDLQLLREGHDPRDRHGDDINEGDPRGPPAIRFYRDDEVSNAVGWNLSSRSRSTSCTCAGRFRPRRRRWRGARRYGVKIMVDLMRVPDKAKRAVELERLGVDYLNLHVSIDEQMIARTPLAELKSVAKASRLPVAVAGGLNSETVAQAVQAGATILIVGGAIIKEKDVTAATRTIKKAIRTRKALPTGLHRKYGAGELLTAFRKVSSPNVADAMQKRGVVAGLVPRMTHGAKLVGPALTVRTADGDWAKPVEAIDRAKPGDVIVIDVGGGPTAVWGELAANSALVRGVAGVVVDGAVRDVDAIIDLGFPCFSRHVADG